MSGGGPRGAHPKTSRPSGVASRESEERWHRRHWSAFLLRTTMVVGPLAASVAAMAVLSRTLPTPAADTGLAPRLAWWAAVLVGSLGAMWCVDRLTRKLAPLAALLDMAVLFPGRAPTRLRVARLAGDVGQLQALSTQARENIEDDGGKLAGTARVAEEILALVGSLRAHDRHTRGHSERVRVYTDLIAEELRLPTESVDRLRWAALLHDIGKLQIATKMLNKPAKLSA